MEDGWAIRAADTAQFAVPLIIADARNEVCTPEVKVLLPRMNQFHGPTNARHALPQHP
jgi:hypothetical protein